MTPLSSAKLVIDAPERADAPIATPAAPANRTVARTPAANGSGFRMEGPSWKLRPRPCAHGAAPRRTVNPRARFPRPPNGRHGRSNHKIMIIVSVDVDRAGQLLRQFRHVYGLGDRGAAHAAFPHVHVVLEAAANGAGALHRPLAGGAVGGVRISDLTCHGGENDPPPPVPP